MEASLTQAMTVLVKINLLFNYQLVFPNMTITWLSTSIQHSIKGYAKLLGGGGSHAKI